MSEDNQESSASACDISRKYTIKSINVAASGMDKTLISTVETGAVQAAAQIATATAILYLGDCIRETKETK